MTHQSTAVDIVAPAKLRVSAVAWRGAHCKQIKGAAQDQLSARKSKVIALVAHPGSAATKLGTNMFPTMQGWTRYIVSMGDRFLHPLLAQSQQDGAMPLLQCMLGADVEPGTLYGPSRKGIVGWLVGERMVGPPQQAVLDETCVTHEGKEMLWKLSQEACGPFFAQS